MFSEFMNTQKLLSTIIILLIIYIYYHYYTTPRKDFKISQVYLDNIQPKVLNEKYPILIYDRIIEPKGLLDTLFKYAYQFSSEKPVMFNNQPMKASNKYTLVYNQLTNANVNIIHPFQKDNLKDPEYVTIKLQQNQVIILPYGWFFYADLPMQLITLDDVFSKLIFRSS